MREALSLVKGRHCHAPTPDAHKQHESRACCCAALMTGGGDPKTGVATDPRPMKAPLDTQEDVV